MNVGAASVGELRRELAALESRLASYPELEVRELEAARARRADVERTVANTRKRIAALEAKRRLDAPALAYERTRLDRAERALEHEVRAEARLSAEVPERSQFQPEAAELRIRRDAFRDELGKRREAQVRAALESPGSYLERTLGKRPQDRPARDVWVRAATAIERYRFDHDVRGPSPLGTGRSSARPNSHTDGLNAKSSGPTVGSAASWRGPMVASSDSRVSQRRDFVGRTE